MSEKLLMDVIDELKLIRKELKQSRMVLEDIYKINEDARRRAEKQIEFSNTALMETMKHGLGDNPALKDMFNKMAMGKGLDEEEEDGKSGV